MGPISKIGWWDCFSYYDSLTFSTATSCTLPHGRICRLWFVDESRREPKKNKCFKSSRYVIRNVDEVNDDEMMQSTFPLCLLPYLCVSVPSWRAAPNGREDGASSISSSPALHYFLPSHRMHTYVRTVWYEERRNRRWMSHNNRALHNIHTDNQYWHKKPIIVQLFLTPWCRGPVLPPSPSQMINNCRQLFSDLLLFVSCWCRTCKHGNFLTSYSYPRWSYS